MDVETDSKLIAPIQRRVTVGAQQVAVALYLPDAAVWQRDGRTPLLFCIPGGGLGKGYFDLSLDDGDAGFSFARAMTARGLMTITVDPPGIGDSSRPDNGFALTPRRIADVLAATVNEVCRLLQSGEFNSDLPSLPAVVPIAVAHSVGALFAVEQQRTHHSYRAMALLGFAPVGMPSVLNPAEQAYNPEADVDGEQLIALARARYDNPFPELAGTGRSQEIYGGRADKRALQALRRVRAPLLATASIAAIIPGSSAQACAAVEVPLLLVVGDQDICGPPSQLASYFPACTEIKVQVLADAGHSHFVFASCHALFERLEKWVKRGFSLDKPR